MLNFRIKTEKLGNIIIIPLKEKLFVILGFLLVVSDVIFVSPKYSAYISYSNVFEVLVA